jgi:hypothetical protein
LKDCQFISVAEEENRNSRYWDPELADEDYEDVPEGSTPPVQSQGNMSLRGENMAHSPTVSTGALLPPWAPGYPAVSHVDTNTYSTSSYLNYAQGQSTHGPDVIQPASFSHAGGSHGGGLWPSQFQGHVQSSYYNYDTSNVDQDMQVFFRCLVFCNIDLSLL